jgi:uncharacterized protein
MLVRCVLKTAGLVLQLQQLYQGGRVMIGILKPDEMEKLLSEEKVARLGVTYHDRIYVVPVNYVYDGRFAYGYTSEGVKVHMMREHPEVCFEVDQVADLGEWKSVIGWGTYEELDGEEAARVLAILIEKLSPDRTLYGLTGHTRSEKFSPVVYRISIDEKTGRYEHRAVA